MPTDQPSNAPDETPNMPREEATAAGVIADEQLDDTPGGGGLGGAAAADRLGGSGRSPVGTARNSPIDVPVPDPSDVDDAKATAEAQAQAATADPADPHPTSQ